MASIQFSRPAGKFRLALLAGAACGLIETLPPARAQSAQPAVKGVEDVVVTAQKRKERLQNVPIAVTAVSSVDLQRAGVTNIADLNKITPGLQITQAIGVYAEPVIRSVGTSSHGPGIENPIATYVDGVYLMSASGSLLSLYDIDQVATLKGPQGTLFGRNATGGLIQVTTKAPTHQFTGNIEGTVGNLGTFNQNLYLNEGISDSVAANLAASHDEQEQGFGHNLYNGDWVGAFHSDAVRGKISWQPDAATDVTLSADYAHRQGSDIDIRTVGPNETGKQLPGGWWDIDNNVQPQESYHGAGTSLTVKHDFTGMQLLSITAYRGDHAFTEFDADSTPRPTLEIANTQTDRQVSEELQLLSNNDQRLTWVAGLYFLDGDSKYDPAYLSLDQPIHAFALPAYYNPPALTVVKLQNNYADSTVDSFAAFGQATYKVSPATNATLGLRYTADFRHINSWVWSNAGGTVLNNGFVLPSVWTETLGDSYSKNKAEPSGRVSLDHRFSPEMMAYVSYNRGYRSGSSDPLLVPSPELKPETLDAFETGLKSNLLDNHLRFNAAAYYYIYRDRQVQTIINGQEFDYNAPRANIYGIDGDVTGVLTDELSVTGGFSATHAIYSSFPVAFISTPNAGCCGTNAAGFYISPNTLATGSATGKYIENTPFYTLSLTPVYRLPSTIGDFTFSTSLFYNGGWYGDPGNVTRQKSYGTVAADISWAPSDLPWLTLRLWGRNLTNQNYAVQTQPTNFGNNINVGPGRTYGLTVGAKF